MAYQLPNGAHISNHLVQMIGFAEAKVFNKRLSPFILGSFLLIP
jgi:hypothetical protein